MQLKMNDIEMVSAISSLVHDMMSTKKTMSTEYYWAYGWCVFCAQFVYTMHAVIAFDCPRTYHVCAMLYF